MKFWNQILDRRFAKIVFNNFNLRCKSFKAQMNNKTLWEKNNMNTTIKYNRMRFSFKSRSFNATVNNKTYCGRTNMNITIRYNRVRFKTK